MTMEQFSLTLDLPGALALFLLVRDRPRGENPDLERIEDSVRGFLYEKLSIAEMEEAEACYRRLAAERGRRVQRS
jgi:hypothetical protein